MKILVINGPNLNMLGIREPDIYGKNTYAELVKKVTDFGTSRGHTVECFQSNHEGAIVDKIQEAYGTFDGIVINPAAYTHTSVALPAVEVHISDISTREDFRRHSFVSPVCIATIKGLGFDGYTEAVKTLEAHFSKQN